MLKGDIISVKNKRTGAAARAAAVLMSLLLVVTCVLIAAPAKETEAAVEPTVTAKSALCYCENTGEAVYSVNADAKMEPYSITKVMTALITVMNVPLDKRVKVSETACSQPGSSATLIPGETVTIEQLLYGALTASGNDAAYALAEAVSGNAGKFVKQMNRTAKNIGCKKTKFANPSGLKDPNNYTTANDLLKIMKVAFENDTILQIAGTKKYLMKATDKSRPREFKSNVFELTDDEYIYAGKNGFVSETEATTAFGYRKNGLDLFVILLGDTRLGRMNDARAIVRYAGEVIDGVLAVKAGEKKGAVRIKHGEKTKLSCYTETDGYAYIPSEGSKDLVKTKVEIDSDVKAPVKKGDVVGTCKILVGEEEVNEVPLVIREDVGEGWFTSYLGISNRLAVVLGMILAVLAVFLLVITIMRAHYRHKRKRARKRRAMEIARREMEEEQDHKDRGWDM